MNNNKEDLNLNLSSSTFASSSAEVEEKKMVALRSSDGQVFEIEESVACLSNTIKNLISDGCGDGCIPLPNVTSKTLTKVIEFCKNRVASRSDASASNAAMNKKKQEEDSALEKKKKWAEEFFHMRRNDLFDVILAANYMDIKELLEDCCQRVADTIKNMTVEEVREYMSIECDFTEEEEDQIRKENAWAFE